MQPTTSVRVRFGTSEPLVDHPPTPTHSDSIDAAAPTVYLGPGSCCGDRQPLDDPEQIIGSALPESPAPVPQSPGCAE